MNKNRFPETAKYTLLLMFKACFMSVPPSFQNITKTGYSLRKCHAVTLYWKYQSGGRGECSVVWARPLESIPEQVRVWPHLFRQHLDERRSAPARAQHGARRRTQFHGCQNVVVFNYVKMRQWCEANRRSSPMSGKVILNEWMVRVSNMTSTCFLHFSRGGGKRHEPRPTLTNGVGKREEEWRVVTWATGICLHENTNKVPIMSPTEREKRLSVYVFTVQRAASHRRTCMGQGVHLLTETWKGS